MKPFMKATFHVINAYYTHKMNKPIVYYGFRRSCIVSGGDGGDGGGCGCGGGIRNWLS
jgi:hypothetical protein